MAKGEVTLGDESTKSNRVQLKREYLEEQLALIDTTNALLVTLQKRLTAAARKYVKDGRVTNQKAFDAAVARALTQYNQAYSGSLLAANESIMTMKADQEIKALVKIGMDKEVAAALSKGWEAIRDDEMRILPQRKWDDNIGLKNRIKTVEESANTVVKGIVNKGVEQGLEISKIVKNIEQYVKPTPGLRSAPPRSYAGLRKKVRYGSIQYNALRIARTESARTYRTIQTSYYDKFDFVVGYRWILSNRHRGVDTCDSYAGKVYKSGQIPSSHPNCLCDILTVIDKAKALGLTPEQVEKIFG